MIGYCLVVAGVILSYSALAKESAKVLPSSVYRARLVGISTTSVSESFNEKGQVQGLSQSLNRTVTVQDLAENADASTRSKIDSLVFNLNALQPGLGDSLSASNLYSDFSLQQNVALAALEHGLTSKLSVGIRVPVVKRTATHKFRVETINNALALKQALGDLSPAATAGLFSLSQQELDTAFFENQLFLAKGYEAPRDFTKTQVGDVELGGKYNFFQTDSLTSTALVGFSLPTGAKPSLTNPFDKGNSKEAFCYAVQVLQEAKVLGAFTVGGAAKLAYSLPDSRNRAVPKDENDSLPSLLPEKQQVQTVRRQRGAQIETEISAAYRFAKEGIGLWGAYQFSAKGMDKFSGDSNLYYSGLSKNSNWKLYAAEVGADYSTISAFRRGGFPLPLEISILYNRPIGGMNTPLAAYTRLDLMLYF